MGSDKTQPTRIDADEYARFKQYVQDVHGTTRGHLKTEIENALREYRADDGAPEQLTRIEQDLATVKALVAEGEGDGGEVALSENDTVHTHTPSSTTSNDRPIPNAPRHEKVDYLANQLLDGEDTQVGVPDIRSVIQSEYSFGDRTLSELVPLVLEELASREGVVRHPENSEIVGWGESAEKFREYAEDDNNE